MNVFIPTQKTLDKYGLSSDDWLEIFHSQGNSCAICHKPSSSGRYYIDHKHLPKYKTLPPEVRRKAVRGILDFVCNNRILTKGVTIEKLRNAADYLERFELRFISNQKSEIDQS